VSSERDWVVPPGEILREWREERGMDVETTSVLCFMCEDCYRRIEAGTEPITERIAMCLAIGTGIRGRLWLALEKDYRNGLAAGRTWTP
jgi:plasmid maintenance system antidote protein VapI